MKIIPAIDIKGGKCVRLYQGQMDQETVYSDNPLEVAGRWADAGAEMLHIVDLDGAVEGAPVNLDIICQIISCLRFPVQVGGGIRGIPLRGKIGLSRAAAEGMRAIRGWQEVTDISAVDVARRFEESGVSAIVFTDIQRDGTLAGPNIESIKTLSKHVKIPVIASGGVSDMRDIEDLLP